MYRVSTFRSRDTGTPKGMQSTIRTMYGLVKARLTASGDLENEDDTHLLVCRSGMGIRPDQQDALPTGHPADVTVPRAKRRSTWTSSARSGGTNTHICIELPERVCGLAFKLRISPVNLSLNLHLIQIQKSC